VYDVRCQRVLKGMGMINCFFFVYAAIVDQQTELGPGCGADEADRRTGVNGFG